MICRTHVCINPCSPVLDAVCLRCGGYNTGRCTCTSCTSRSDSSSCWCGSWGNTMQPASVVSPLLALVFAPLLFGIINRTKAVVAGRVGQPLLQLYYDLWKLLQKGAVYSRTTTWVFRAGPVVGLGTVLVALALVPFGGIPALLAFPGDLVLFAYLLGVGRFFTVVAALDTGSSFEGMGASREVTFSTLAEPALLLGLAAVARQTGSLSLSGMVSNLTPGVWAHAAPTLALVAAA